MRWPERWVRNETSRWFGRLPSGAPGLHFLHAQTTRHRRYISVYGKFVSSVDGSTLEDMKATTSPVREGKVIGGALVAENSEDIAEDNALVEGAARFGTQPEKETPSSAGMVKVGLVHTSRGREAGRSIVHWEKVGATLVVVWRGS